MNLDQIELVSVVIPTFNRSSLLQRCLESLCVQTYKRFEVLVCDDGSTDDSEFVAGKFVERLKLCYYKNENFGGPAVARNVGINNANGEYVAFLDSDDWWKPTKIEESVRALNGGYDVVYHDMYAVYQEESAVKKMTLYQTKEIVSPAFEFLLCKGNVIINSSVVVRRSLLLSIGGVSEDPRLIAAEDYDTWLRLACVTERFFRIANPLGYYTFHVNNISASAKAGVYLSCILERHLPRFSEGKNKHVAWISYALGSSCLELGDLKSAAIHFKHVLFASGSIFIRSRAFFLLICCRSWLLLRR